MRMLQPRLATTDTPPEKPPPKQTDPYSGSAAHKQWAADVKQRAGGVCQDPQHEGPRLVCKVARTTTRSGATGVACSSIQGRALSVLAASHLEDLRERPTTLRPGR